MVVSLISMNYRNPGLQNLRVPILASSRSRRAMFVLLTNWKGTYKAFTTADLGCIKG